MSWRVVAATALATAATIVPPAHAGTPIEVQMTCPVGGESFKHIETASYSTFGSRPDGKPYGSWVFPMPLPECPSNGLVLYREFKPEEQAALAALVASADYAALRPEAPYFRAQWLASRLDLTPGDAALWLLHRASWQVDDDPVRKRRYQEEFVERAGRAEIDAANIDSLFLRFYVANALRELGQFDNALGVLDSLHPEAPTTQSVSADFDAEEDRKQRSHLAEATLLLRAEIERGETAPEPLRMIPEQQAAAICAQTLEAGTPEPDPWCGSPDLADQVEEMRGYMRQNRN